MRGIERLLCHEPNILIDKTQNGLWFMVRSGLCFVFFFSLELPSEVLADSFWMTLKENGMCERRSLYTGVKRVTWTHGY